MEGVVGAAVALTSRLGRRAAPSCARLRDDDRHRHLTLGSDNPIDKCARRRKIFCKKP